MKLTKINVTFERMRNGKVRVEIADGRASKVSPFFARSVVPDIDAAIIWVENIAKAQFEIDESMAEAPK